MTRTPTARSWLLPALFATGLAAGVIPARRAAMLHPIEALRSE